MVTVAFTVVLLNEVVDALFSLYFCSLFGDKHLTDMNICKLQKKKRTFVS